MRFARYACTSVGAPVASNRLNPDQNGTLMLNEAVSFGVHLAAKTRKHSGAPTGKPEPCSGHMGHVMLQPNRDSKRHLQCGAAAVMPRGVRIDLLALGCASGPKTMKTSP